MTSAIEPDPSPDESTDRVAQLLLCRRQGSRRRDQDMRWQGGLGLPTQPYPSSRDPASASRHAHSGPGAKLPMPSNGGREDVIS
jgi:hypothetical protein